MTRRKLMLTSVINRYVNVNETQLQLREPFTCVQLYWIVTCGCTPTEQNHFTIPYTQKIMKLTCMWTGATGIESVPHNMHVITDKICNGTTTITYWWEQIWPWRHRQRSVSDLTLSRKHTEPIKHISHYDFQRQIFNMTPLQPNICLTGIHQSLLTQS
jgi:hypothetical protein